jgi:hypothetical protein
VQAFNAATAGMLIRGFKVELLTAWMGRLFHAAALRTAAISLIVTCVFSAEAWATCGDYLHVGGTVAATNDDSPANHPSRPRPCNGPNCSRDLPSPASPMPMPRVTRISEFTSIRADDHLVSFDVSGTLDLLREFPCAGYPLRVTRPPRSESA